ncbi:MAG TPA: hypothetical protein VI583_09405 [Cyclobacteriaceae bacterium]|nr:hypothetical protein [Cyclobacteriaceae bacterium]
MKRSVQVLILFSLVFLLPAVIKAQLTLEEFGQNRVQYKNFHWRYLSSDNFDVYFYDGGDKIAQDAIRYLEKEFDRITDILGYAPYSKTKIFLYNSIADIQQSNIGVNETNFTVGGQTDFFKSQVEIAYQGTQSNFKKELDLKFSKMLIKDMMYGGSLSEMFQNSYLLSLPEWFIDGAANYIAFGWDVPMDDFIRDRFNHGKPSRLNKYTGGDAALIGQSVWNFIAEKYGHNNISNILNLTRIIRNEEKSIANTLGIPFREFIREWTEFYREGSNLVNEYYWVPSDDDIIIKNRRNHSYDKLKINPDGKLLAYTRNLRGKYQVRITEPGRSGSKTYLSGGYRAINQDIDYDLPLISWIDNINLAVIDSRRGSNYLWFININSNRKVKKELTRLNNIRDFDVSESGNLAVLSADLNGQSDLFLISLKRNSIKRLTNDVYDDINPQFVPGGSSIIFSSNRPNDTLTVNRTLELSSISDIFNLYVYNIDTTRSLLYRVTNTLSKNSDPIPTGSTEFYFLSDQQGVNNIYKFEINKRIYMQISKYRSSILNFDIGPNKQGIAYTMLNNRKELIYFDPDYDLNDDTFSKQTRRQELLNAKYVAQKLQKRKDDLRDSINFAIREILDFSAAADSAEFRSDTVSATIPETAPREESQEFVDTDNYVFDRENVAAARNQESFLSQYRKLRRESDVMGPFDYKVLISANNVVTSFVIDPLMGFGIKLETQMNDMLEDNKFFGGVLATTDLRSGILFGEYQYLKHAVDFNLRYERKSIYRPTETASQKYSLNIYEAGASLPFTTTARIALKPFIATTRYYDLDPFNLTTPAPGVSTSEKVSYGGFKSEFVFDNSVASGVNVVQGSKVKLGYTLYQGLADESKSFSNLYADVRNYLKIHRELVLAARVYYGRFFPDYSQSYLLGGVDNWLFSSTNRSGENDPLDVRSLKDNSKLLFAEYVTSLRGFEYNTFHGSNALLGNVELRFPIIRYFHRGPISSNFLRNLLLIGFYDIGSAWTINSPFSAENDPSTEIIKNPGSPFQAVIRNFKNPWLQSYGFGIRTVLLGYYMKFDLAYPIEDYIIQNPKLHVSLGYDF